MRYELTDGEWAAIKQLLLAAHTSLFHCHWSLFQVDDNESRSLRDAFARALLKAERVRFLRADLQSALGQPGHRPAGMKTGLRGLAGLEDGKRGSLRVGSPSQEARPGVEAGWRQSRQWQSRGEAPEGGRIPPGCVAARNARTMVGMRLSALRLPHFSGGHSSAWLFVMVLILGRCGAARTAAHVINEKRKGGQNAWSENGSRWRAATATFSGFGPHARQKMPAFAALP